MNKYFITVIFIFMIVLPATSQSIKELRILSEDRYSIVLEFIPKLETEQIIGNNGTKFTSFRFWGSQITYDSSGQIDIFRAVPIHLPSKKYSLQIQKSDFEIRNGIKLLPKPKIIPEKDFGYTMYYEDNGVPKAVIVSSTTIVDVADIGETSFGYIGTIRFHPVQVVDQGKVKVYTRIIVRIEFGAPHNSGVFASSLMRGIIPKETRSKKVNYRQNVNADFPLAQGVWYQIEVREIGIYKLDYDYFSRSNVTIGNINSFRLFGNGGRQLPEDPSRQRPESLQEITRLVIDKNNDGKFDPEDYIVFYGSGTSYWSYDANKKTYNHSINSYSEKNYYFFTFGSVNGRTMDSISSVSDPFTSPKTDFQEKVFVEQERYNLLGSGRRWVGKLFTGTDQTDTYSTLLSGLVPSTPVTYRFVFLSRSTTKDTFSVYQNGQLILTTIMQSLSLSEMSDNTVRYAYQTIPIRTISRIDDIPENRSVLKIQFGSNNQDAKGWLDWFEILYRRHFEAVNDILIFTSPDTTGLVAYTLSNFSSREILAFDVTDHSNVKRITQLTFDPIDPTICKLQLPQVAGSTREMAAVGQNGLSIPSIAIKVENSTLHDPNNAFDFIIISPKEFLSEANRLKSHRESKDNLSTIVVDIAHIYNEFSGGLLDPIAIRDFLKYAQTYWTKSPQYVLLFGWGHYDYKNIATSLHNWIPPLETLESIIQDHSYTTDDSLVILYPDNSPVSMALGRLPARNQQEAAILVDKIISYEETAPLGPWRNRTTFVADDGKTSSGDDGNLHTKQTDSLAEGYTPDSFEKRKIYIVEYPTVNSASGRRKPAANADIIEAFNQGTLIINYIGHGNERVWAHEAILTREETLPQLTNHDKLTFLMAATCSFARWDNSLELSGGEQILTMEQGGAIAVIASVRGVYSTDNFVLNCDYFSNLFQRDSIGLPPRIGDAMRLTKLTHISENDKKFHLLGDPTLRLIMPHEAITIDSIDGVSTVNTTIMKSLGRVHVVGTVRNPNNTIMSSFNGKGLIQLFDSKREVVVPEWNQFKFVVNGSILYRGEISITNGNFKTVMPIPKDVTFGHNSRISLYAWSDQNDGVGYTENVVISGTDTTIAIDTIGPQVSIYLDDTNFRSGNLVKANPVLIVQLEDESGINTSTVGVGHRLTATINNPERTIDLVDYYRSNLDTYTSGEVRYPFSSLVDGRYSLNVKAWDIQNNSSEAETFFEVYSAEDMALLNLMNYPNPFSSSTTFTFQRNTVNLIDIEIKIYTIAGRQIATLLVSGIEDRFVHIPWNGKDNDGDEIANGIYFYKVIVKSDGNNQSNETIGKLVVMH